MMMFNALLAVAALASSGQPAAQAAQAPAVDIQVDVGRANWARMTPLPAVNRPMNMEVMAATLQTILRERQCQIAGATPRSFNVDVPYAVQLQPDGRVSRILVGDIGCRPLETYVGSLVTELAREGVYRASGNTQARWYGSSFNFNLSPG
jgi:hypothetical protein